MSTILGSQVPRLVYSPKFVWSAADDAAMLGESYGLRPDEWQHKVLESWLGEDSRGRLVSGKCGLAVARQNGKNGTVELSQLYKMVVQGRRILHTAHEVKTARKHFTRMLSFFENERKFPDLAAMVQEIRRTNGQEAIVLTNGASLEFIARSKGSGRGYTVDDLYFDESQELTDEQLEALLPTISAAPSGDPQQIYLGTPPGPTVRGEVFPRLRAEGVAGKSKRLSWHEWSIPDDLDPHEAVKRWRELAYATNPALGIRLNITTVEDELGAMSAEGFCRERLGQWLTKQLTGPFPTGAWDSGVVDGSVIAEDSRLVFAVDVSADRTMSHIAVAGFTPDGLPQIEVVASRAGTGWVSDWFAERGKKSPMVVVVQERGAPASSLIEDLANVEGVSVVKWGGVDLGNATAQFFDLVKDSGVDDDGVRSGLVHLPQPVLDLAAAGAMPRILTDGGMAWDRRKSRVDIAPLVAVTGAVWHLLKRESVILRSVYEDSGLLIV